MKPFTASSPTVEVNGQTVLSIVAGMAAGSTRAKEILTRHGLEDPKPDHWYPQQKWLDAFKEISEMLGPNTLYMIGRRIPETAAFPPAIDTLEKALSAIDMAYKMNHRGGDIGSYEFHLLESRKGKVVCKNPYPSDFDRGIVHAMADRFKPQGSFVIVEQDEAAPTRKKGDESCTFLVSW